MRWLILLDELCKEMSMSLPYIETHLLRAVTLFVPTPVTKGKPARFVLVTVVVLSYCPAPGVLSVVSLQSIFVCRVALFAPGISLSLFVVARRVARGRSIA